MDRSLDRHAKKTPWFPPEVKPVRHGVYQRDIRAIGKKRYSFYANGVWYGWGDTVKVAHANGVSHAISAVQNAPWRGLAKEPK
jgi:hypothetical protein